MTTRPSCILLSALALVTACDPRPPPTAPASSPHAVGGTVVVTVNNVPITREEIETSSHSAPTHAGAGAEQESDTLDRLIQEELLA